MRLYKGEMTGSLPTRSSLEKKRRIFRFYGIIAKKVRNTIGVKEKENCLP